MVDKTCNFNFFTFEIASKQLNSSGVVVCTAESVVARQVNTNTFDDQFRKKLILLLLCIINFVPSQSGNVQYASPSRCTR